MPRTNNSSNSLNINCSLIKKANKSDIKIKKDFQDLINKLKDRNFQDKHISISVVIPVYNEEKTIKKVLNEIPKDPSIEIIVVDDCSTDNSLLEIKKVQNEKKNIRIICNKKNKGYGGALLTGIQRARGKILITMDADGQHRASDIYSLIEPIINKEADITIGSRYLGSYHYTLPFSTRLGEAFLEVIIKLIFGQKVKNNQGGFRAFHRRTFNIFKNIKFKGYAFTTELILVASLNGYRIKECPIKLLDRKYGTSYIKLYKLLSSILFCIILYFLKKIKRILFKK